MQYRRVELILALLGAVIAVLQGDICQCSQGNQEGNDSMHFLQRTIMT